MIHPWPNLKALIIYRYNYMNASGTTPTQEPQTGMTILGGMAIGIAMSWLSFLYASIPWSVIFIFIRRFQIRYYTLTKHDECMRIQRRVKDHCSHTSDNNKGHGYAFGKWYILYIHITSSDEPHVTMIATESAYKDLVKDINNDDEEEDTAMNVSNAHSDTMPSTTTNAKKMKIYDRRGSYSNVWYRIRSVKSLNCTARPEQAVILDKIKALYQQKGRGVFYIYGPPGSGKSMIGLMLAEHFNGGYSNTFAPWDPGNTLSDLMEEMEIVKEHPLIVAFDEVDVAIHTVHKGIPQHKNIPITIMDKNGWNRFFDNYQRGLFPYTIIVMTSNKPPKVVNDLCTSYLRAGRVDGIYELDTKTE